MEELDLPPVHEGLVDAATLAALLDDIEATGAVRSVTVRAGRTAEPPRGASALGQVRADLLAGRVPAVQLRYRHDGREWCDTILARPGGAWRVVRIPSPFEA